MPNIDERILTFFKEHHVINIATCHDNKPWSSTMFYAPIFIGAAGNEGIELIFTSEENTIHVNHFNNNPEVSGTIAIETKVVGKIQGIQLSGIIRRIEDEEEKKQARMTYLKKFPVALLHKLNLWSVKINYVKMTDNRLGFGKKLIWDNNN